MVEMNLRYGKSTQTANVSDDSKVTILRGKFDNLNIDDAYEISEIKRALDNPIGCGKLSEIVKSGQKAAVMVSDITRPSPTKKLIPHIISELNKCGIEDKDIKIVFGMGIHRPHTEEEQRNLLGADIFDRVECTDSCSEDYVQIGKTKRGTPINICRSVAEADIRICTGNIEYHYFAGYSGGAKALMPGACNYESIKCNHSLQLQDGAVSGQIEGNPVREDIDEAGERIGISFILNVVLNEEKKILKAFAGHYIMAHREGCRYLDTLYSSTIPKLADIVLASAGGFPKDINLYQAQKALDNASHAVKTGGTIILLAECREGFGEPVFEEWIRNAKSPDDLIDKLKNDFVLGGHKAAAIARVLKKAKVYFVSEMNIKDSQDIFFEKKGSLQNALDDALKDAGENADIIVIPQGGSILPKLEQV